MMFKKFSLLALVAPLVAALTVEVPQNPRSGHPITIRWHNEAGDNIAIFSIFVIDIFHDGFVIANNILPGPGEVTFTLSATIPARDGYTMELVDVENLNNVYASSDTFSIAPR